VLSLDFFTPFTWLNMMKRLVLGIALSCVVLSVLLPQQRVLAKESWTSVQSKNFFLVGNGSEKDIKQVAIRLEQFREVFTHLFPRMRFNSPIPTTVVVFKSESSFRPFKPGPNLVGYFQPGQDVNYISMTTELQGTQDPYNVIFHEYTHLLVNNTLSNAPLWFNEGLAEYYSTFAITNDQKFELGKAIANHVFLLRDSKMLPLRTLFEVDHKSPHYNERNKQSIFYAESWALMHYLIIGKEGRLDQLAKFIDLLQTKMSKEEAFKQAFQMTFEAMEKELHNYVKQDRYNIVEGHFQRKLETDKGMQTAPISEAEAQAYMGDLLLHSNRKDSETYLQKALTLDPNLPLANAAMGMAKLHDGKPAEALANLDRAVQANSQNYLVHYYYAFALSRQTRDPSHPTSGLTPETYVRIRAELLKAIELRPDYPASYSLLCFVALITGDHLEEARTLVTNAIKTSPGRSDLVFMLGQLYLRTGDYKQARQLLEQVTKSNAEEDMRQNAQMFLNQLTSMETQAEEYKRNSSLRETVVASVSTDVNSSTPQVSQTDSSSWLREVLRPPRDGETQLQATLLRIECDAKGIVFVVKSGERTLRLRTATFDGMEITTYNPDVKADITCGIRKPEDPVVVCFIPQVDKRNRTDGLIKSVEFVPASFRLQADERN
jgi:tetratricopeptide (TPR) repeat protein